MQIGISLLKSKIGRRFFILFFGCVFLPIIILLGYSYQRVADQLKEQSLLRIEKNCKIYSLGLYDRLVKMNNLILVYASYLDIGQRSVNISQTLLDQITTNFSGLGLYKAGAGLRTLTGHLHLKPDAALFDHLLYQGGKTTIYLKKTDSQDSVIYLIIPTKIAGTPCLLIAKPVFSVLWGVGVNNLLPAMTELAVYDGHGQLIAATKDSPGPVLPAMSKRSSTSNYLQFNYTRGGKTYVAGGWSLFLESRFNAQTWTIIFSGMRSDMVGASLQFRRTFPLIAALALWTILFLWLFFIRRTLEPLMLLQKGTVRVGKRDFSSRVEIKSGDEFEQLAESFNIMSKRLHEQFHALALINEIDSSILSNLDSSVLIPKSLRMISEFFSNRLIMLGQRLPGDPNRMRLTILEGGRENDIKEEYAILTNEEREVFLTRAPFRILRRDAHLPPLLVNRRSCDDFLILPIDSEHDTIGTLIMDFRHSEDHDDEERINQARQLADHMGIALNNARLVSDLERLSLGALEALARTVDAKSKWTAGHSEKVAEISMKIGRAMNWSKDQLEMLFRAGLLHDIGKIGVPIAILDKPGRLNDAEYDSIKTHPAISGKILEPIQAYQDILPLVTQHHERFDGKGYPLGLSGEAIDIGARILCVADVYEALISQRPYREGWVREKVINFIRDNRGTMFDPDVVDVFLSLDI